MAHFSLTSPCVNVLIPVGKGPRGCGLSPLSNLHKSRHPCLCEQTGTCSILTVVSGAYKLLMALPGSNCRPAVGNQAACPAVCPQPAAMKLCAGGGGFCFNLIGCSLGNVRGYQHFAETVDIFVDDYLFSVISGSLQWNHVSRLDLPSHICHLSGFKKKLLKCFGMLSFLQTSSSSPK